MPGSHGPRQSGSVATPMLHVSVATDTPPSAGRDGGGDGGGGDGGDGMAAGGVTITSPCNRRSERRSDGVHSVAFVTCVAVLEDRGIGRLVLYCIESTFALQSCVDTQASPLPHRASPQSG